MISWKPTDIKVNCVCRRVLWVLTNGKGFAFSIAVACRRDLSPSKPLVIVRFSLPLPLIHCILCYHWSLCDIYSSVFFRMSSNWKHAVYGFFQTRLFHLAIYIEDSFMPHGPATWPWQIHYLWGVGGATGHIHMVILHFFLPEPCGDFSHSFTMRTWWSFWG